MPMLDQAPETELAGMTLVAVGRDWMAQAMVDDFRRRSKSLPPRTLGYANGQVVARYGRDPELRADFQRFDVVHADGQSLVFLSKMFADRQLPERVAITDFFHDAAKAAVPAGMSFYFLGTTEEENARAVAKVKKLYPDLKVAGRRHGYFSREDEPAVAEAIRASGADVLWVGIGTPKAQAYMARNRERLVGVTWAVASGGLFNFLSGNNRRAPMWMQRAGLEWVYRMSLEPRRLAMRYLVTNVEAVYRAAANSRQVRGLVSMLSKRPAI